MKRLILLIIILLSCRGSMEKSSGFVRKIVIVSKYEEAKLFEEHLNIYRYTPQREFLFEYSFIKPSDIVYYKRHHTIVYVGVLGDTMLEAFTTSQQRDKIEERGYIITKLKNPWVQDQVLYVIGARTEEDIRPAILANRGLLIRELYKRIITRLQKIVYERGREEEVEKVIERRTGLKLKIPLGFKVLKDTSNFVVAGKHEPDRFFFFVRLKKDTRDLVDIRDSVTNVNYNGDYVEREYINRDSIRLRGIPFIKITGIWQNDKEIAGGPFVMLAFVKGDFLYIMDGAVFAPEKKKLPYILQMEAILRSIEVNSGGDR